ncbi:PEP/pyruvate-binding domain-containing protein [Sinanaerobacter sp. ZZT-01]|uniref:PEP/pyruvate-binding domain-containing protein n=1 Tax=Sinanaerobacter sp. ZZT-01 TaxID=3111540 RepID=UPI002D7830B0|nr:PEP/pyruvate-binding domain-containing protein [Sinanaerobacter sp. ZZT-01]WRR92955.1 PEP/pyruvate-binding domain-containing protein [Sinanaerobacter sp. ZZT-01]
MNKVYNFNSKTIPLLSEVGGKAKALIETTNAGFPVPGGLALTISFFTPWTDKMKETEEWKSLISEVTKEKCDALKALAENLTFSVEQKMLLSAEMKNINSDFFAVRSSSPEEDLQGISFAGMYETFLGVTTATIERYVAKAFASMFDFRVMEYKDQHGIPVANTRIAIIIQKQLYSSISGIGFSVNPHNNSYDEVMINASFGLGEYIVSGKVSPDSYIVNTAQNRIPYKKINEKKVAIYLNKDGGIKESICEAAKEQALTDEQILELAKMIKKCEGYYGSPIDTEWAYENGKLYLLQSRPITTYFPLYEELLSKPNERKELYLDIIKMTQGFQWSMSELGGDIFCELVNKAKQGMFPVGKDGAVYDCHGRIYILLGNLGKTFGESRVKKIISSVDPTSARIFSCFSFEDYIPKYKPEKLKGTLGKGLKLGAKMSPSIISAAINFEKTVQEYYKATDYSIEKLDKLRNSSDDFARQIDVAFEVFDNLVFKMMPIMLAMNATISLKKMFKDKTWEGDIISLSMDLKGNPTSKMGYKQVELASFPEFIEVKSFDEFSKKLRDKEFSTEFMEAYAHYMKLYGCRGIGEIDIASVRTRENIEGFYTMLKQLNIYDNALIKVRDKKKSAYDRLLREAIKIGKREKFLKLAKQIEWMGLREHPKYMYVYAIDVLRHNVLKIAEQFVLEGRLNKVEDVFYLTREEITKAQKDKSLDLIPFINEEKKIRKLTENVKNWPTIFNSRGEIFIAKREAKEGELLGEPVSPGVVRGRAKILHEPFEKKLEKGEILVTITTEPSWTPIFINACAVVMEIGGALQHGAIIAREYGLPCVTGIEKATEMIKDGDLIEVDGTNGFVKIIQEK